jgi:hypothetical protein
MEPIFAFYSPYVKWDNVSVDPDSAARLKLAGRILTKRLGGGPPVLLSEIAQLRFLAESDEERAMPIDRLARRVIERERERSGVRFPTDGLWRTRQN